MAAISNSRNAQNLHMQADRGPDDDVCYRMVRRKGRGGPLCGGARSRPQIDVVGRTRRGGGRSPLWLPGSELGEGEVEDRVSAAEAGHISEGVRLGFPLVREAHCEGEVGEAGSGCVVWLLIARTRRRGASGCGRSRAVQRPVEPASACGHAHLPAGTLASPLGRLRRHRSQPLSAPVA